MKRKPNKEFEFTDNLEPNVYEEIPVSTPMNDENAISLEEMMRGGFRTNKVIEFKDCPDFEDKKWYIPEEIPVSIPRKEEAQSERSSSFPLKS